ncbi:MAG: hypothetical protein U5N86_07490 [Planctomycetota bacterium]|nr:hypothetical protein [Planctomycetota bacterium]
MIMSRALQIFLLGAFAVLAGCGGESSEKAFIDSYLDTSNTATSQKDPVPGGSSHSALSGDVEEHPEMIGKIWLPEDYMSGSNLELKLRVSRSYILKGMYSSAEKELLKFLRSEPNSVLGSFLLALAYCGMGDVRREKLMLERTLTLDPKHYLANYNLGCLYLSEGSNYPALLAFDECLSAYPAFAPALYNKSIIALEWCKYDAAVRFLQIADRLQPDDVSILNNLAVACERSGRLQMAEGYYLHVLTLDKDHVPALQNLSGLYLASGRLEDAFQMSRRWQAEEGKSPLCAYRLSCIAARRGNLDRSLELLRDALQLGYDNYDHALADPDLAPLYKGYPGVRNSIMSRRESGK